MMKSRLFNCPGPPACLCHAKLISLPSHCHWLGVSKDESRDERGNSFCGMWMGGSRSICPSAEPARVHSVDIRSFEVWFKATLNG